MMAVRTNLKLCATFALSLWGGCAGNLIAGVPPDGGGEDIDEPSGSVADAGPRDARAAGGSDAASSASKDAGGANIMPQPAEDAAAPGGPADAGSMVPPVGAGRDLSTDKGKFLGAARCDKAGALFCDDFESQAAGAQPGPAWTYPFAYKPTIDTTRAARGTKSLKFSVNSNTPAQIEETETFPAANNTIFGRMFVWMAALPSSPSALAHYTLVAGRGTGSMNEMRLDGWYLNQTKQSRYGVGSDGPLGDTDGDGKDDDDWHIDGTESQSLVRATEWTCLEWQFKGDTNETRIWIDGVEQSSLHTTTDAYYNGGKFSNRSYVHPQYTALRIGWWVYHADATPSPFELWIDEVAVDKDRIGCVQ